MYNVVYMWAVSIHVSSLRRAKGNRAAETTRTCSTARWSRDFPYLASADLSHTSSGVEHTAAETTGQPADLILFSKEPF